MGWGGDLDEEARVAAALGYVAHIVALLSSYLDVPLRYPLIPSSSRSFIIDPAPVHSASLDTQVHRRFWGMGQTGSSDSNRAAVGSAGGSSSSPIAMPISDAQQQRVRFDSPLRQPPGGAQAAVLSPAKAAADASSAAAAAAAAGDGASDAPLQLQLFYVTGDRTRFAYAVFLLNKDIEQLLHAHGMSSQGPSQVLANLYKLTTAAVSGLPQQQQQQQQGIRQSPRLQQDQQPQQQQQQEQNLRSAASNNQAPAAAGAACASAAWLLELPLPPGYKPNTQQQHVQAQQQPSGVGQAQPVSRQAGAAGQQGQPAQQQQQQQQRGAGSFWRWPWQADGQQETAAAHAPSVQPQQQQQQQPSAAPAIATWDWGELWSEQVTGPHSASLQQQQQQQQRGSQGQSSSSHAAGFDLERWQHEHDAQLQAAEAAAAAAEAAAAAAEKAADVALGRMPSEGGACRQQQQQQQPGDGAPLAASRTVASLLSLKWAGDE
jgi:hypothetical protein